MTSKVDIWMPLYVADYLSATSRLTTEQHGAYLLILMDYWKNGPPPDNDQVLAQITRMPLDAWGKARGMLQPFFDVQNEHWLHHRVNHEMVKANHNKAINIERGKKGAEARWQKNSLSIVEVCSTDSTSPSPSPSPITSIIQEPTVLVKTDTVIDPKRISCPAEELLNLYHEECKSLPRVMMLNATRKKHLVSRWRDVDAEDNLKSKEEGIDIFRQIFKQVQKSDFLCGRTQNRGNRVWKANFDWLMMPTNFLKVVEGQYDNGRN